MPTASVSGLWSNNATWGGSAPPANDQPATINAGINILIDVDQSGFADGMQTVTLNGDATGVAMLYFMDGYNGWLKMKDGYHIVGQSATYKGRILANSNGAWGSTGALGFAYKAVIDHRGASEFKAANIDVRMYCTEPTNKYVETYGTKIAVSSINTGTDVITLASSHGWSANTAVKIRSSGTLPGGLFSDLIYYAQNPSGADLKLSLASSGSVVDITSSGSGTIEVYSGHTNTSTAVMNVLQNVTGDIGWSDVAEHNAVCLSNVGPISTDTQYLTIATGGIAAGTITLSANVDSTQYPGAVICLSSRNCSIRFNKTSSFTSVTNANNCVFGEIRNINTGKNGYALHGCVNSSASTVLGFSYSLNNARVCTVGSVLFSNYALSGSNGCNINYTFGVAYPFYSASNNNVVNLVSGATTCFSYGAANNIINILNGSNIVSSFGGIKNTVKKLSAIGSFVTATNNATTHFVIEDGYVNSANRFPLRVYTNAGNVLPLISGDTDFQTPPSGNSWIFEATPNSSCDGVYQAGRIIYSPINPIAVYATSGSKTLTYKIWPVGWSSSLTQDDVILEVSYLDSASGNTRTTVYNTSQTYANGAWRNCSVTFNPSQTGIAYVQLYLKKYVASAYLLIDPVFTLV